MKTKTAKLMILFVLLLASVSSLATMTSSYSTYDSITPNADGNGNLISVTVMVLLEGATNWNGQPPAKHTGEVALTFGGVYSGNNTAPVNPNYNMNLSAIVTLDDTDSCFTDGTGCLISEDQGYVDCSVAGLFYFANGANSGKGVSIKNTVFGPPPQVIGDTCHYTTLACSTGTPTCKGGVGFTFVPSCPDYMKAEWLVIGGACIGSVGSEATGPGPCD